MGPADNKLAVRIRSLRIKTRPVFPVSQNLMAGFHARGGKCARLSPRSPLPDGVI